LGSASGIIWRIVVVCGWIGTRLSINCVHMLNWAAPPVYPK
jgi:hypothetical protein